MRISLYSLALILISLGVQGCDHVDNYREPSENLPNWQGQYILLEEYTGVRCPNCPAAAQTAHELQNTFGDKLIVIALHPTRSTLTMPNGQPDTIRDAQQQIVRIHNQNLTQADARTFMDHYQISALPSGIINRQQAPGHALNHDSWYAQVLKQYSQRAIIEMTTKAQINQGQIEIHCQGIFLDKYSGGPLQIVNLITEDSLTVVQTMPSGQDKDPGYVQNHVMRQIVASPWGQAFGNGQHAKGDALSLTTSTPLNNTWRRNHIHLVSYIYDQSTGKILQVSQIKIQ